jgi:hypothetical protein
MKVRKCYTWPELTRTVIVNGRKYTERIPGHPTREAKPYEINCWLEDHLGDANEMIVTKGESDGRGNEDGG